MHHMKVCCLLFGLALIPARSQAGTILITEQEASLPNAHGGPISRGIGRGPSVELVQPAETAHSPPGGKSLWRRGTWWRSVKVREFPTFFRRPGRGSSALAVSTAFI